MADDLQLHHLSKRAVTDYFIQKHVARLDRAGDPPRKSEVNNLIREAFDNNVYELTKRSIHTFILWGDVHGTGQRINDIVRQKLDNHICEGNQGISDNQIKVCTINGVRTNFRANRNDYYRCHFSIQEIDANAFVTMTTFQGRNIEYKDANIPRVLRNSRCTMSKNALIYVGVQTNANPDPELPNRETFIINHIFKTEFNDRRPCA